MKQKTIKILNEINRDLYHDEARSFSASRQQAWLGWEKVWENISAKLPEEPDVLDLGCGNGRFGTFLISKLGPRFDYTGLDFSPPLLKEAQARLCQTPRCTLIQADLVNRRLKADLKNQKYDLIVLMGVFHHIPSFKLRHRLLHEAVGYLKAGGLLTATFWQFMNNGKSRLKVINWPDWISKTASSLDQNDLETGDYLLPWIRSATPRYCHFIDSQESQRLTADLPVREISQFIDDGQMNHYYLWQMIKV